MEASVVHQQRFHQGPMGSGYDVVICSECGMGYANSIPSQEEMDRYYASNSKYSYEHTSGLESKWDFKRFEETVNHLERWLPRHTARILDIGCSTGGLLATFKRRGYKNLKGCDPSERCVAYARRLHGVDVQQATIADVAKWKERYDLILMLGVLEHIRDLEPAIFSAARLLSPEGLLYIAVPDVSAFADCENAPYQQFSYEHVNFFSKNTLQRMLAKCGFREIQAWQWQVEWRENILEPILSGLFRAGNCESDLVKDEVTKKSLARYVKSSGAADEAIAEHIDYLIRERFPIIVWGAGTLARRLLATSRLSEANIVTFVDSNPNLRSEKLAGKDVVAPESVVARRETIVICSEAFGMEIARSIRDVFEMGNRVISISGREILPGLDES
jgi:2-polyprenyl-3-methyl-5-hydroxy-6-metoxy-1,4-benzoquinol methylase